MAPLELRLHRRFEPYTADLARPMCAYCPASQHKRAVFWDRTKGRGICARCAAESYRQAIVNFAARNSVRLAGTA